MSSAHVAASCCPFASSGWIGFITAHCVQSPKGDLQHSALCRATGRPECRRDRHREDHCRHQVSKFPAAGGKSEHILVNLGDTHLPVKVRCSNDSLYRVTPVYQVVETGQCKSLVSKFPAAGGKSEHILVNLGDTHLPVKGRCSNDSLYRVTPVYQVVETGQCKSLVVTRSVGAPGLDRLTIPYLPTTDINCNIIEIFNNAFKSRMKINALKLILKMKGETNFSDDATYM
ncbi:unnamed protein product [Angiostrongylus costaricensis]|uniref:Major sperm protein n=1 Tax=Angiostrongylus costaricensis TaxID=334426 RepID=A0A0R3Q2L2_ANGCS|nr:unnamed protein product [Angiostrongylus costaricensis]